MSKESRKQTTKTIVVDWYFTWCCAAVQMRVGPCQKYFRFRVFLASTSRKMLRLLNPPTGFFSISNLPLQGFSGRSQLTLSGKHRRHLDYQWLPTFTDGIDWTFFYFIWFSQCVGGKRSMEWFHSPCLFWCLSHSHSSFPMSACASLCFVHDKYGSIYQEFDNLVSIIIERGKGAGEMREISKEKEGIKNQRDESRRRRSTALRKIESIMEDRRERRECLVVRPCRLFSLGFCSQLSQAGEKYMRIPESAIPGIRNGNALSILLAHKRHDMEMCVRRMKIESYIAGAHHELMIFYLSSPLFRFLSFFFSEWDLPLFAAVSVRMPPLWTYATPLHYSKHACLCVCHGWSSLTQGRYQHTDSSTPVPFSFYQHYKSNPPAI